uniref:Glycosyltransferase n=2 Tax=Oryza glaberrima TaxID=4538 RepID=I1Q062_ORYGL
MPASAAADDATRPAAEGVGGNDGATLAGRDHVVVFPLMSKGHMIPLLHFAAALAAHHGDHLRVTLVTTPANLAFARRRLPPSPSVRVVAIPFPAHPQIPPGVESTDALPSQSLFPAFLRATALLREPFAEFLASLPSPPPLVLVSDFFLGFTQRVADDAGVRRLTFNGMSPFSLALCFTLASRRPHVGVEGGAEFHVPGFPDDVRITADEVPDAVIQGGNPDDPVTQFLHDEVRDWDHRSWGVLVNSFAALDGDYAAILESFYHPGSRAWLVGPLFLAAGESPETKQEEDDDDDDDPEGCVAWLDERAARPGSVVYVSFGTQAHLPDAQLDELAHGLVDSGHAFLWAIGRSGGEWSPPVDAGGDGKIVRGWVPQRRVLSHPAVGAFVTHAGWNSVLESLAAGRPMLAWPVMAEQAANAKLVADIIGAGVRVVHGGGVVVGRAEVAGKVGRLMDSGEEGRAIRARAEEVREAARAAVGEGGASREALWRLVDELRSSYVVAGDGTAAAASSENGDSGKC